MQLSKGVEWAVHCCTVLAIVPKDRGLSAEALSEFFEVPSAYLAKQLQALSRAGITASARGKGGGYSLARPVDAISLLDILEAIEGKLPAFRCTEIRQNGPCALRRKDCKAPCEIASAFADAEQVYKDTLGAKTLAMIMQEAAANAAPEHLMKMASWVQGRA